MADTGERPNWTNLERVDLLDMDAVSTLGQGNLARTQGALLDNFNVAGGVPRGGLLSKLVYDGADSDVVTFGPMSIGYAPAGPGGELDHGPMAVFRYDLNQAHQASSSTTVLSFTGRGAAGARPFLWARRVEVATDFEPRRFWDELTEVEYTEVVATRMKEAVELSLSHVSGDNVIPSVGNWVRIARVVTITDGANVVLAPRHVFDGHDEVYEASATAHTNGKGARYYSDELDDKLPSLPDLSRSLIASLCKLFDGRRVFDTQGHLANASIAALWSWRHDWTVDTFRGVKQLQEEATDHAARLVVLEANVTPNPSAVLVIEVVWGGAAYGVRVIYTSGAIATAINTVTRGTAHGFELTLVPIANVTIYNVIPNGISLPLSAGDAPNIVNTYPVLRLRGVSALPTIAAIIVDGYTVQEPNAAVDTIPMLITVLAGSTP